MSPVTNPSLPSVTASTSKLDVIDRGLISVDDAETALRQFEQDLAPTSFIWPTSLGFDLSTLRSRYPALLLTTLIAGGHGLTKLREVLNREFKEVVARRIIVDANKDNDLLLALLMHKLW